MQEECAAGSLIRSAKKHMEVISLFESDRQEYWLEKIRQSDWDAGDLLYEMLSSGTFFETVGQDSEVLLLTDGDDLASYCTYARLDDIQPTELTPWMGFVYTYPAYRGRHCVGKLFEEVVRRAKAEGFPEVYISTSHIGLYEKYGCEYKTQMINIQGEPVRVYAKKIE